MMRKWTAVLMVALMVLAMVGCGGGASANSPTGAVENGVKALKEMNTANMEKYFVDAEDLEEQFADPDNAQMVDMMKALFTKLSIKVTKEEINEDDDTQARVTADITTINMEKLTPTLTTELLNYAMENPNVTEEEGMKWLANKLKELAGKAETTTITGVEIYCIKKDGNWMFDDSYENSDFFEAILGGADSLF
ncbi:DUF5105 domain-containing protein [Eubacteriales bacterium OttesenSCG-928-M02]|nr:DUF5105 domain-containing protein [Eubacteriales bacterium OttesenSCG-928-M02]